MMRDHDHRGAEVAHNLPSRLSSFVGREREIAEVQALLGEHRLVTLVGAPGVGKTRLALQTMTAMFDRFPDGVWLVEFAPLADPALVPHAAADVLGIREQPGRALTATLVEQLQSRQLLLLLDNCEHLIGAVASLAERLLQACPGLHVLATSREPLAAEGERTRRVPSLSVPGAERQRLANSAARSSTIAVTSSKSEAVRLFVERAKAVAPSFELSDQHAALVGQICARLDGIPLALELAAARVRTLSVEQIAARLDDRFRLLTGGRRTALPRQQTLRGAVDWSHDLLSDPERVLLRRLSVFSGGFTLETAEAVVQADGGARMDVLDGVGSLAEKSLLEAVASPTDEPRFRMLETIREYGLEQLGASGEAEAVRRSHFAFCLALAEDAASNIRGPAQRAWLDRLDTEHANLRAALTWGRPQAESAGRHPRDRSGATPADSLLRLTVALFEFWYRRGHFAEGYRWSEQALVASGSTSSPLRAMALARAGDLAFYIGKYDSARSLLEASVATQREFGDERELADTLASLAVLAQNQGDDIEALAWAEESVRLNRQLGDQVMLGRALRILAVVAWRQGALEQAEAACGEDPALALARSDKTGYAQSLRVLGCIALSRGDYARAVSLCEESLTLAREVGNTWVMALAAVFSGTAALRLGHQERAAARLAVGLELLRGLDNKWGLTWCLEGIAGLACARGQPERGARLLGAAQTLRDAIGGPPSWADRRESDRNMAEARALLSDEPFATAYEQGRAMSLEQVVTYALDLSEAPQAIPKRSGTTAASARTDLLTAREREVAALVARGLKNRQIAESLVISERTVHGHVASILARLGFRTRAQIAAWAVEQSVTPRR